MKRRDFVKTGMAFGAGAFIVRGAQASSTLNLYSARHYNTDEALYGNFADASGIKINRIDAEPDPLVERLKAEGDKSPCDVLITTDAGRIEDGVADRCQQRLADGFARTVGRQIRSPRIWIAVHEHHVDLRRCVEVRERGMRDPIRARHLFGVELHLFVKSAAP